MIAWQDDVKRAQGLQYGLGFSLQFCKLLGQDQIACGQHVSRILFLGTTGMEATETVGRGLGFMISRAFISSMFSIKARCEDDLGPGLSSQGL